MNRDEPNRVIEDSSKMNGHGDGVGPATDLPAVTPPTAGFLVQLFGVPLAIVAVAVIVWLLFGKIAASHRSPQEYIEDLRSPNFERRWSAARDLASILPHNEQWQRDDEFAQNLANELDSMLSTEPRDSTEIRYMHYVAETLGEFRSVAGVPALRRALGQSADRDVREAAVMGLGKLADRNDGLSDPAAIDDLIEATHDDDRVIRLKSAWVLGRTNNDRAVTGLVPLLGSGDHELRLNAATALTRLGSTAAFDTLAEMIDLEQLEPTLKASGLTDSQIETQMVTIPWAALQSLTLLADRSTGMDLERFRESAQTLANSAKSSRVVVCAREFLIALDRAKAKK